MKYYTGVGSRETPPDIMNLMTEVATFLQKQGYILRSGAAPGADTAFENGSGDLKEIWVPWVGFNGSASSLTPSATAIRLMRRIHPSPDSLNSGGVKLHARNCHQVLGPDLNDPSDFLLCWTENGLAKGGTRTAIRLAEEFDVPVFNMGAYNSINRVKRALEDFFLLNVGLVLTLD